MMMNGDEDGDEEKILLNRINIRAKMDTERVSLDVR